MFYDTLALRILNNLLVEASYSFRTNSGHLTKEKKEALTHSSSALAFMRGTGFELMLDFYKLDYNPNSLRQNFFSMFNISEQA